MHSRRRTLPAFSLLLLFVCYIGCGGATTAKVSGSVSCSGKSVVMGTVNLMSPDGHPFQGQIGADGKYSIEKVPFGKYSVMIHSPEPATPSPGLANKKLSPEAQKMQQELHDKWVAVPMKYSRFEDSGLSLTVDGKKVLFDINLTD